MRPMGTVKFRRRHQREAADAHRHRYLIRSDSDARITYEVLLFDDDRVDFCSCPDFRYQAAPLIERVACKHLRRFYEAFDAITTKEA